MVKKSMIHLKRLHEIEHPDLSCMWFKMCLDDQTIVLAAWYRQWQLPIEIRHLRTDGVNCQVERFREFQSQVNKVKNISRNIMILGDINIDMLKSNNHFDRTNIARTMPIYREILEDNGMSVLNKN